MNQTETWGSNRTRHRKDETRTQLDSPLTRSIPLPVKVRVWSGPGFDISKPGPDQNRTQAGPDQVGPGLDYEILVALENFGKVVPS
jgi:hypothetical protein